MDKKSNCFINVNHKLMKAGLSVKISNEGYIFGKDIISRLRKLKKIYKSIPDSKCNKCGGCCRLLKIPVFSIEYLNILKYLKENWPEPQIKRLAASSGLNLFIANKYKSGKLKIRKGEKGLECIFLDPQTNLCRIYSYRPFVCRTYGLFFKDDNINSWRKNRIRTCNVRVVNNAGTERIKSITRERIVQAIYNLSDGYIEIHGENDIKAIKQQNIEKWFSIGIDFS